MDLEAAFERALDHAYDVFGAQPPPRRIDACLHCVTQEDLDALERTPPREIDERLDRVLLGNLGSTLGGVREFRWFAPRLLEHWRDPAGGSEYLELLAGRFRQVGWTTWPDAEVEAVRGVWRAAFRRAIADPDAGDDLGEVLEGLESSDEDLAPYVADWDALWADLSERDRCLAHLRALRSVGRGLDLHSESPLVAFLTDPARLTAALEYLEDPAFDSDRDWLFGWIVHLLP